MISNKHLQLFSWCSAETDYFFSFLKEISEGRPSNPATWRDASRYYSGKY